MTDDPIDQFKSRLETFLVEMEMPAWKFGLHALRDNVFVHQLREGRRPRAATITKLDEWMERYRAGERDKDVQALGKIRALRGGTVILDSEGKPENLPHSVTEQRFALLVKRGLLLPSGDHLPGIGGVSQTLKISAFAEVDL